MVSQQAPQLFRVAQFGIGLRLRFDENQRGDTFEEQRAGFVTGRGGAERHTGVRTFAAETRAARVQGSYGSA